MKNINELFLEKGYLLEAELQTILSQIDPNIQEEIVKIILQIIPEDSQKTFISKKDILLNLIKINLSIDSLKRKYPENIDKLKQTISSFSSLLPEKKLSMQENTKEAFKLENEVDLSASQIKKISVAQPVTILKSFTIPPRKITMQNFVNHFRKRYTELKKILEGRLEKSLISINKIGPERQNLSVIGMVSSKKVTKNKNIILEVEDLTGKISVLISKNKNGLCQKASEIVLDEVIGLNCSGNSEILFAQDIIFPDLLAKKIQTDYDEYVLFISDLQVGSSYFLEQNFLKFVKWLNGEIGNEKQKEIANKVKYLFIVGDVIDGVGVHPLQEPLLEIKDVVKQYDKAAELFGKIRKDISIIMCPGNHDAVRIAEPQPQFDINYAKSLYELENIYFVSNPALVSIRGVNILMYHGFSFDYFINEITSLRMGNAYHNPRLIAQFLLKKRHLAPTHTATQYIPCEEEDPLVISLVPDVFVSAHVHRSDVSSYNNLLAISCSCWQSKTPLEEKYGHEPDPGKVPMLHLKTGEVKMLDFG